MNFKIHANAGAGINHPPCNGRRIPLKYLLIMKLIVLLTIGFYINASADALGQAITLSAKDASFKTVLQSIQRQSGYSFIITNALMEQAQPVTINVMSEGIEKVLPILFKGQPFTYEVNEKLIKVLSKVKTKVTAITDGLIQQTIRGRVTDSLGNPLQGVAVQVKESGWQTITNREGRYEVVDVYPTETLRFRLLSYEPFETPASRTEINVVLKLSYTYLDETIVIGYGTTSRRNNTGSVENISSEDIAKQPVTNVLQALKGRMPGVYIQSSSGLPGAAISVQVRGKNSITAGTDPLYIIDGVPFNAATLDQFNSVNNGGISILNSINPTDIERIEVLKDADATAIYGSRAANGVVLITTKKGTAGETRIGVDFYSGFEQVGRRISMMNTPEYLSIRRMAFANDGITPTAANAPDLMTWDTTVTTNWVDKLIGGTAQLSDAKLSLSGGNIQTQFFVSAGYRTQGTVFPDDARFNRYSGKFTITHATINDRFKANLSVNYLKDDNLLPFNLTPYINLPPNYPIYNEDGSFHWFPGLNNPIAFTMQKSKNETANILSNGAIEVELAEGLQFKANLGYNEIHVGQVNAFPSFSQNPSSSPNGYSFFGSSRITTWILEPQLHFKFPVRYGTISGLAGATFQKSIAQSERINAFDFSDDALLENFSAAGFTNISNDFTEYKYASLYGRISYNLLRKYIVNINFRRDGSTRFGPGKQFGNFGAVGIAWLFHEESALKDWNVLSFGKLRASYGITGNDQINDYQYLSTYVSTSGPYQIPGLSPSRLVNPEFSWESNQKLDVALELGFFSDRLLITSNYYRNRSGNQLVNYPLPAQTGFTSYQANLPALLQNSGWEFSLNAANIKNADFSWSIYYNISFLRNKLISFPNLGATSYGTADLAIGKPLDLTWQLKLKEIDSQSGAPVFEDADKSGHIGYPGDYIAFRSLLPDYYGGIGNAFTWKNLHLSIFFQFAKKIVPTFRYPYFSPPGTLKNQDINVLNQIWRQSGDKATIPRASLSGSGLLAHYLYFQTYSGRYTDGTYIKLDNVQFAYDLIPSITKCIGFKSLRFFIRGQNLYSITKYKGFDPEAIGTTGTNLPNLRTITIGFNGKI